MAIFIIQSDVYLTITTDADFIIKTDAHFNIQELRQFFYPIMTNLSSSTVTFKVGCRLSKQDSLRIKVDQKTDRATN